MLNILQIQEIATTKNVIFYKESCPFCVAAKKLADALVQQKIWDDYSIYVLDKDFDNQTLVQLVSNNGWSPDGIQSTASKPQIFSQGEYIGGNFEFYKSKWNVGNDMPNLKNPMRF